jgi:hypothetical protein
MTQQSPTFARDDAPRGAGSNRAFVTHFIEMVVVMLAGMGLFSGLAALAFAAAGSSLTDQSGAFRVVLMGFNMTVPMVAWMSLRGHPTGRSAEMALAMLAPTFMAAVLVHAGVLDAMTGLGIQHAVMVPAMLAVMLWRYDAYAHRHRTGQH